MSIVYFGKRKPMGSDQLMTPELDVPRYVSLYHEVRNIPYGAAGDRDPDSVLRNQRGSCSGKHILLRNFLRQAQYKAEVVTIFTHFNKAIPICPGFSPSLCEMIKSDIIPDFHHFVRIKIDGRSLDLDATWPDKLQKFGFPVNRDWDGSNNTILASTTIEEFPEVENLAAFKEKLLKRLSPVERIKRDKFFGELTAWMGSEKNFE